MSRLCARLSSSLSLIASLLFLLAGFAAPAAHAQFTAPIDIPSQTGGGNTNVVAISKNGIVVGTDDSYSAPSCLFTWQSGVQNEFDCNTGYRYDQMVGVNNAGVIVGNYGSSGYSGCPGGFTGTSAGGITPLANPPSSGTDPVSGDAIQFRSCASASATAINNNGDVVGYANVYDLTTNAYFNEAVLWPAGGGSPVYLGPFAPIAINDNGQVMGADVLQNGWFYAPGKTAVLIGDLGEGPGSLLPTSMNSSGQITGLAQSAANGGSEDIFLWAPGSGMADLGGTCSACANFLRFPGYSVVINDSGEIATAYYDTGTNPHGLTWTQAGGFQPLNDSGFVNSVPQAIDASGQIAGTGATPAVGGEVVYWASSSAAPLDMGAGQISFLSDNGWAAGTDYGSSAAAAWNLTGTPIGGPPVISITTPANNATYQQGQSVGVYFSCSSTVGISSCTGQDNLGDVFQPNGCSFSFFCLLNTNTPGNFTVTVNATTSEGITGTSTVNYTVASASQPVTGAKMRGYGALAADQQGDLYRFTMNVEDTQQGAQAGRFDLWSVDRNGFPRVAAVFDADSITSVNFTNTGLLGTNKKGQLLADTVTFQGIGEYNDQPGYTITVTATDAGNPGVGVDSMNISVTDSNNNPVFSASGLLDAGNISSTRLGATPPPVFTAGPPPVTQLEATGPSGAVATFDAPVAVDYNGNPVSATCSPASGSTFPLGVTHGTCTATDAKGHTAAIRFRVNVRDTTPPVFSNVPQNITTSATMPSGAVVTYTLPTATDTVDPNPTVTCAKASGATFAITTTTVVCTAKDASGNKSQATFTVTVNDTTPPVVTPPANITAEATSSAGAVVKFKTTVTDAADNNPAVVCSTASGSTFPLGVTTVSCSATDKWGVSSVTPATFTVTVQDTTAPKIANEGTVTAVATSASGAAVSYTPPTWTDAVSGTGSANCLPASGSTFPIGTTTVTCSATDGAGNMSTSSFKVKVTDDNPITFPGINNIYYNTNRSSAAVTYTLPTVADILTNNVTETCSPPPGSTFQQGSTTVTCTAKDNLGNKATATFQLIVTQPD